MHWLVLLARATGRFDTAAPLVALACAMACEPGPTHVLGRVPARDAAAEADADVDPDFDERDARASAPDAEPDSDLAPWCFDHDDCDSETRPFCSEELERCVVCLYDRHCESYEYCRDSTGVCVERRN
jgi:hypothetical protein